MAKRNLIATFLIALMLLGWGSFFFEYIKNKGVNVLRNQNEFNGIRFYKEAPGFVLTDHHGNRVSLSDFGGKLVLIAWGFTHCPDICPLILSELRDVMKQLNGLSNRVQVVFISIDPQRDSQDRLKSYIPFFHESFIGLTGTPEEIEGVVNAYDAFFIKHPDVYGRGEFDTWDSYQMTHTTKVYLIDQYGRLLFYYPYDKLKSTKIVEDIKKILNG